MAINKGVIILMPNGYRRNVKVTPNTTVLQVSYVYIQCRTKVLAQHDCVI